MTLRWIILTFCCVLLVGMVSAIPVTAEHVSNYEVTAESGYVIYKIIVDNLPIGTDQTHLLHYNGQTFLLTIHTYTDYGIWKNANISLTLPDGTVQTSHTSASTIAPYYKTTIQPVFRSDSSQLNSGTVAFITVDLMIGVNPVGAQFSTQPANFNPESSIPFTAASGDFGSETTVYVYEITEKEFLETIGKYDPHAGLPDLGATIFQWVWSEIIGFLNNIPIIGPIAIQFLDIIGTVLTTVIFWITFVVSNIWTIVGGIESMIMMMAVINAGTGKRSFSRLARNMYQYNVTAISGIILFINIAVNWIRSVVGMVSSIVMALKPL